MSLSVRSFVIALGAAAALCGCSFDLDPDVLKKGDAGDADDGVIHGAEWDASVYRQPDASVYTEPDAFVLPNPCQLVPDLCLPDAGPEDATLADAMPTACTVDSQCGEEEICGLSKGCIARCSEQVGCFGPSEQVEDKIVTEGAAAFYVRRVARDSLGNVAVGAAVCSWNLEGDPIVIRALPESTSHQTIGIADGYFYVRRDVPAGGLARVALQGAHELEEIATDVADAWISPGAVWWTKKVGSAVELWRLVRGPGSVPSRITSANHLGWFAGTDAYAFFADTGTFSRRFSRQSLIDLSITAIPDDKPSSRNIELADGNDVFSVEMSSLYRVDDAGLGSAKNIAPPSTGFGRYDYTVAGPWVYWWRREPDRMLIGRGQRDGLVTPQTIVQDPAITYIPGVTVVSNTLVWWHHAERRLMRKQLPSDPCSVAFPCASGTTCGTDNLCL